MKKSIYRKYGGALARDDIKDGIEKSFENAKLLLNEAKRFVREKKYGLAYYFLYTSEEEFIKIYLLLHYFVIVKEENINAFWTYFRNHIPKKRLILFKRFIEEKDKDTKVWLENIYFLINEKEYQTIRENAIYCDAVNPKQFINPQDVFEERDCNEIILRLDREEEKWAGLVSDKKKLDEILKFLKENPSEFVSPSKMFEKTHGKPLFDRKQQKA